MPVRPLYKPSEIDTADLQPGRLEPHYLKILSRLLAAHALTEKLTALGYERACETLENPHLCGRAKTNSLQERRHAELVYGLLADLGTSESAAERLLIGWRKLPSFEAPVYFAQQASGELDFVMASISLEMTGLLMIGLNYREASYAPYARVAELIAEEEADHQDFAIQAVQDIVARLGVQPVEAALRLWLPKAANFFGPPGSGFTYDCLRLGLKRHDNQELAELFIDMLERRFVQMGIQIPHLSAAYPHQLA